MIVRLALSCYELNRMTAIMDKAQPLDLRAGPFFCKQRSVWLKPVAGCNKSHERHYKFRRVGW